MARNTKNGGSIYKEAYLSHECCQTGLAQQSGLSSHVGAREQQERGISPTQVDVVRHKAAPRHSNPSWVPQRRRLEDLRNKARKFFTLRCAKGKDRCGWGWGAGQEWNCLVKLERVRQ